MAQHFWFPGHSEPSKHCVFSTNFISGEIKYNPDELLDVKWFTYDEIMNMQDQLRSPDLITEAISAVENNKITNIDVINIIK